MNGSQCHLSLGPFQGITDAPFRNVFKRHFGCIDKFYTPFFSGIQKEHAKNLQVEEIDPRCNDVETLTPQILSTDAEEILRFAKQCKELGYQEINLNMGCPFPRVANKKRGCGLLPYPDMVEKMFEVVFEHIGDMKFSVKCRLGYHSPEEIEAIIPIFNRFPLSELIIHPRIGKQLYKGEADVERFKLLRPYINAPLVYNGDIFSVDDYRRIQETINTGLSTDSKVLNQQPVNQFMLGRGILANPFLAEQIKNDPTNERGLTDARDLSQRGQTVTSTNDKTDRLHAYVLDLYDDRLRHAGGSPKVLGRMKELWSYLMYSFDEPQNIWRKIKKINALKDYEEAVEIVFRSHTLR